MATNQSNTEACMYCGAELPPVDHDTPPAVNDHAAWRALREQHLDDCEWIATQAHRINCDGA